MWHMAPVILESLFISLVHSVLHTHSHCLYSDVFGPLRDGGRFIQLNTHTPEVANQPVIMLLKQLLSGYIATTHSGMERNAGIWCSQRNMLKRTGLCQTQQVRANTTSLIIGMNIAVTIQAYMLIMIQISCANDPPFRGKHNPGIG